MYRIDNATAITPVPAPAAVGPNPDHFFTNGNPGLGVPATVLDDDWANAVQEEICGVVLAAGLTLSKTNRAQLLAALQTLGRIKLTANTTFYVSGAGNDGTGTGAVGAPWLTLQRALNVLQQAYDLNGYQVTIQLVDNVAAYPSAGLTAPLVGASNFDSVIVNGNVATPANTSLTGPIFANNCAQLKLQNVKIGGTADGITAGNSGIVVVGSNVVFGGTTGAHMYATTGARIILVGNYSITAGAAYHYRCTTQGQIIFSATPAVTLTGTPAFGTAFAYASLAGQINAPGGTFTGAATGKRYQADNLSIINSGGGGANYFPGSVAGTADAPTFSLYQ